MRTADADDAGGLGSLRPKYAQLSQTEKNMENETGIRSGIVGLVFPCSEWRWVPIWEYIKDYTTLPKEALCPPLMVHWV